MRRAAGLVFLVFLAGLQEAGPEGRNSCSSNLSLNHSNMRLEVRHGRVPAPLSGHGRLPLGKRNALRGKISSFQQTGMESIPEAWERLQEYILACPHHGMDEWLVLQSFYNRLTTTSRAHLDAAARGAYPDMTIAKATALIEKMVSNQ